LKYSYNHRDTTLCDAGYEEIWWSKQVTEKVPIAPVSRNKKGTCVILCNLEHVD